MRDPFPPNVKAQLFREAQIGFCVVALLLGLFAYITFNRLTGRGHRVPEYVSNGPLPNEVLPVSDESGKTREKTRQVQLPPRQMMPPRPLEIAPVPVSRVHPGNQVELATAFEPVNEFPNEIFGAQKLQSVSDAIRDDTLSPYTESAIPTKIETPLATTPAAPTPELKFPSQRDATNEATGDPVPMIQRDIARDAVTESRGALESPASHASIPAEKSVFQMFAESAPFTQINSETSNTSQTIDTIVPSTLERPNRTSDEIPIYVTKPGDTFWSVADAVYRDGRYFKALYKYNQESVPDYNNLNPGTRLAIPSEEILASGFPDDCPALETHPAEQIDVTSDRERFRSYVTRPGDTLWGIAGEQLGQTSRYREIHRMNRRQLAPELSYLEPLPAGIRLDLPPQ